METPNQRAIPTIILTGFLGVGKTTLLNRLIEHYQSQRTVLLINEFGQIGIDGELLVQGNYDKIELNKGSLFCICVRTDFIFEVERIANELKPELLIIEATGLADTTEMEKMLALPKLHQMIHLKACLCLVDCQNFLKIREFLNAPDSQVRNADLVLMNKTDLVSEGQIEQIGAVVHKIAPTVPLLRTQYANFPLTMLDELRRPDIEVRGDPGEGRPDPVASITLEATGSFTYESWERFTESIKKHLLRFKGFFVLEEHVWHVEATTASWLQTPADESIEAINRLVLIGQRFKEDQVQALFHECVDDETPSTVTEER
ncbi:hypothetical protein CSA56_12255 [candidate division KSB3 bacterium]|uniref:Cobalamin biosynthesis protein CobW n=1 Tax=candidate division KSB3 bacterium TaxID=2044937 RepID=A0A2G6KCB5_9BACT|nr:MAG: hypothetical protein CSA56_12255 [candidate division KSB3 bacterium]